MPEEDVDEQMEELEQADDVTFAPVEGLDEALDRWGVVKGEE